MKNITLFSQIIQHLPSHIFRKLVAEYQTDKHSKGITSWTHLVAMLFCQFSNSQSIREITNGLLSATGNLIHFGIYDKAPSRSSLSYINKHRNWHLFRDFYLSLFDHLQALGQFQRKNFKRIKKKIYLLDSTIISLCITVFDWARYKNQKGAIKLHTLLDYDGCLPGYVFMTEARQSDVKHARYMSLPKGSVVVCDRAYVDTKLLYSWHKDQIYFVTRMKKTLRYKQVRELPLPEDKDQHIIKDEIISLSSKQTRSNYPEKLRRVVLYDREKKKVLELLTNNLYWTASTIAELYKHRWEIEIFFKQLKGHLKIKSFIGTTENAMWIQIWTALITLLMMKYLKEIAKHTWCLANLIAYLRLNLFVKVDLQEVLDVPFKPPDSNQLQKRQGILFE